MINTDFSSSQTKRWQHKDGWLGVKPGVTKIKDAIEALGGICETAEMANGFSFDFREGLVRITCIEQQLTISKLWISGILAAEGLIPVSLKEAQEIFAGLKRVGSDPSNTDIYEAVGVRIGIASGSENGNLAWIEFLPA